MVKSVFAKTDKSYPNLLDYCVTSLEICVLKVNLACSPLAQRQITLRRNTQCNSCTYGNLTQIVSISLPSFTKPITHTHTHT